jgi:hypothetical protein
MLAAPSGADVLGIDFSPNMVERLQRRLRDANRGSCRHGERQAHRLHSETS